MMSAVPGQLADTNGIDPAKKLCRTAGPEDADRIVALLNRCFDPLYAFLPAEAELCKLIDKGCVWVVREDTAVAAALVCEFDKGVASIRQVAVEASRRGNGLGAALIRAYHDRYRNEARRFQHWVDLHNEPAVRMYQKYGYTFTVRKAYEYLLTEKERES